MGEFTGRGSEPLHRTESLDPSLSTSGDDSATEGQTQFSSTQISDASTSFEQSVEDIVLAKGKYSFAVNKIRRTKLELVRELRKDRPDPYYFIRMMTGLDPRKVEIETLHLRKLKKDIDAMFSFNPKRFWLLADYNKRMKDLTQRLKYLKGLRAAREKNGREFRLAQERVDKNLEDQSVFNSKEFNEALVEVGRFSHDALMAKYTLNEDLKKLNGSSYTWQDRRSKTLEKLGEKCDKLALEYVYLFSYSKSSAEDHAFLQVDTNTKDNEVVVADSLFFNNIFWDNLDYYLDALA